MTQSLIIDLDLVIDTASLFFCLARTNKILESSEVSSFYGKQLKDIQKTNENTLQLEFVHRYLQCARPHLKAVQTLKHFSSIYQVTLFSFLEKDLCDKLASAHPQIFDGVSLIQINQDNFAEFFQNFTNIFTKSLTFHNILKQQGFNSCHVKFPGQEFDENSIEYLWSQIPQLPPINEAQLWQNYYQIRQPITISGTVISGFNRGSSQLGFPTANVNLDEKNLLDRLVPGIYAGTIILEQEPDKKYITATSCGWNPQFDCEQKTFEAYVCDFSGNLVGTQVEVEVLYYLRSETAFSSLQDLIRAIELDVELAKSLVKF